jgi:UDP-N-acetylmuramate dehydrogenase
LEKDLKIEEYVGLAPYTTLKIGGRARFFARAANVEHVGAAVGFAAKQGLPLFVLGGGSNVLVGDREYTGLVLKIDLRGVRVLPAREGDAADEVVMNAAAGEDWDGFVKYCVGWGLAGVECLSGIPGLVGGTPIQNVGAYGQEVSDTIVDVEVFDRSDCAVRALSNLVCGFGYRSSIFNTTERDRYIVLRVNFRLKKGGAPTIDYRDLREQFGERMPSLSETREAVLRIRRSKSMVIDPADRNSRSVGSFFKNPVVATETYETITAIHGDVPHFDIDDEHVKLPAAWLITKAGFHKGFELGNAGISANHPLALVNLGGATAADIIALKDEIQGAVKREFGIALVPEPVFLGI